MWASAVVCGLVANNVGPVADIVGPRHRIVAVNVVPKKGLFAGQAIYDCGPLHLALLVARSLDQPGVSPQTQEWSAGGVPAGKWRNLLSEVSPCGLVYVEMHQQRTCPNSRALRGDASACGGISLGSRAAAPVLHFHPGQVQGVSCAWGVCGCGFWNCGTKRSPGPRTVPRSGRVRLLEINRGAISACRVAGLPQQRSQ